MSFSQTIGRIRRRRWFLAAVVVALALLTAYGGSYVHLSRRGMREAKAVNMRGFLYIPIDEAIGEKEMSRHYTLAKFYAPANGIDQALTGADGPVRCILFRLSK